MRNSMTVLKEMSEALTQVAGATGQMIHHHRDTRWMFMRKLIEATNEKVLKMAEKGHMDKFKAGNKIIIP